MSSQLEFGHPLNGGEEMLKEFVSGMMLFSGWSKMKKSVSDKLSDFMPEEHRDIAGLSMEMKFLLLLEVLGPEFRGLWGEAADENYNPQLFREPYLEESKKDLLLETLNLIYVTYIDRLMADEKELNFEKNAYFVETKAHYQTILKYKEARSKGDDSAIREDLGAALVAIMKNEDLFVRLLSTPFTPESAYNKALNDTAEAQHYGLGGNMKTQEDLEEEEVRSLVTRYNKETVDDTCFHLRGTLLSDSLRTEIWAFRFLSRGVSEPPNTKNATPGRDYRRLAKEKGIDVSRLQALALDGAGEDTSDGVSSRLSFERDSFMNALGSRSGGGVSGGDSATATHMTTLIRESVWAQMHTALSTSVAIAARKQYAAANAATSSPSSSTSASGAGAGAAGNRTGKLSQSLDEGEDDRSVATDGGASIAGGETGQDGEEGEKRGADGADKDGADGSGSSGGEGKGKGKGRDGESDKGVTSSLGAAADEASLRKLARRAEMLVYAGYVLNDDISDRNINVALMLMRCFPRDPPTSEKILRMYQRLLTECLPSEQLHKQYSLATVAHRAWELLLERDPALLHFLQNYEIGFSLDDGAAAAEAGVEEDFASDDEDGGGGGGGGGGGAGRLNRHQSLKPQLSRVGGAGETEMPRSLLLLKGWLETAFIGKVPEHSSLYIWDQLSLYGGCPTHFKRMLPLLCCVLLQALREPIMELPPRIDVISALHEMGLDLRTRDLVELLRAEPDIGPVSMPSEEAVLMGRVPVPVPVPVEVPPNDTAAAAAKAPEPEPVPVQGQGQGQGQGTSEEEK